MTRFDDYNQYIQAAMQSWDCPGLALAVVRGEQVIHQAVFGWRDVENPCARKGTCARKGIQDEKRLCLISYTVEKYYQDVAPGVPIFAGFQTRWFKTPWFFDHFARSGIDRGCIMLMDNDVRRSRSSQLIDRKVVSPLQKRSHVRR